ncbi:MAG TPA: hypothetical protein VGL56_11170 [Fimbriimonadaceae bacterium]|jgi:hypothetical protein
MIASGILIISLLLLSPKETVVGDWFLVADKFAKHGWLHPDHALVRFTSDGTFLMKTKEKKHWTFTTGTYKIEEVSPSIPNPFHAKRIELTASSADGKTIPPAKRFAAPMMWIPDGHAITDLLDFYYAKKGYEVEVRKLLRESSK